MGSAGFYFSLSLLKCFVMSGRFLGYLRGKMEVDRFVVRFRSIGALGHAVRFKAAKKGKGPAMRNLSGSVLPSGPLWSLSLSHKSDLQRGSNFKKFSPQTPLPQIFPGFSPLFPTALLYPPTLWETPCDTSYTHAPTTSHSRSLPRHPHYIK